MSELLAFGHGQGAASGRAGVGGQDGRPIRTREISLRPAVAGLLNAARPASILDAPAGEGWIASRLEYAPAIDGVDLYGEAPTGYRRFYAHDLDQGLPPELPRYGAVVCCEGIEHLANPGLFLGAAGRHLVPGGLLVVTTPNVWYAAARLAYLTRGFFPNFPCLAGRIAPGSHMHILPWSFPQLHLFLSLAGFAEIRLHGLPEPKPKHLFEWVVGFPLWLSCARKRRRASSAAERAFWEQAGSRQSLFGRRLLVSARWPAT